MLSWEFAIIRFQSPSKHCFRVSFTSHMLYCVDVRRKKKLIYSSEYCNNRICDLLKSLMYYGFLVNLACYAITINIQASKLWKLAAYIFFYLLQKKLINQVIYAWNFFITHFSFLIRYCFMLFAAVLCLLLEFFSVAALVGTLEVNIIGL